VLPKSWWQRVGSHTVSKLVGRFVSGWGASWTGVGAPQIAAQADHWRPQFKKILTPLKEEPSAALAAKGSPFLCPRMDTGARRDTPGQTKAQLSAGCTIGGRA
jgi:hypothetical protein